MSANPELQSASVTAPPLPARFGAGRVLRPVFGSLGLLAALALIGGAGALVWALETQRDSSGYFTMTTHRLQTSSYALSSESLDVDTNWPHWALADRLGRIKIAATSTDAAKPLFVGIAHTADVDSYLAGVEHDEVGGLEIDPFSVEYRRLSGAAPTALPAALSTWRASATGTGTQTITWPVQKGHWSAVIMNADASRSVGVNAQLAARISHVWWIVTALFVLGGLSLLVGGALVYFGARTPAPKTEHNTEGDTHDV
jgi:hypothetical protein